MQIRTWPALVCLAVFIFIFLGLGRKAQAEATMNCPAGTYDMLDWMTLDSDLRATSHMQGTANPLYTNMAAGKFYWTKGAGGSPWDIQLFDGKYIYLWITEEQWTNPRTYKKFAKNTNMPLVPRCAKGGYPGSTISVPDTSYQTHSDCGRSITQNLLKGVNQVWGPYTITLGGTLPKNLPVMVASYRYNCANGYTDCRDKEEYYLARRYGLVEWAHYSLASGAYVLRQKTIFNQLVKGTVQPFLPCF
ncbi:MAG: hypothetical protein J2P13_11860 [Acidobacteria bacterium]|nr:hypothetical protein [Acidobacteriota bacterium]